MEPASRPLTVMIDKWVGVASRDFSLLTPTPYDTLRVDNRLHQINLRPLRQILHSLVYDVESFLDISLNLIVYVPGDFNVKVFVRSYYWFT